MLRTLLVAPVTRTIRGIPIEVLESGGPRGSAPRLRRGAARAAAELWGSTRSPGPSLGDRVCLALARRLDGIAVTADGRWAELEGIDIPVEIVR